MSLLDDASLIVTPNGYKGGSPNGTLYSVKPTNGDGDMVVTRNTTSTRVNSAGLIESVAFNAPRIDYTNASCPSILVEPIRTNNFTNSQNISLWYTPAENVTLTSNTTDTLSPDGTNNASKITIGSGSPKRSYQITNSVAGVGTFSAYVKAGTSNEITLLTTSGSINILYNLSTLAITATNGTGTITSVGNGWYRITATNTLITLEVLQVIYTNTAGQTIYIWGFQVEAGSTATSYIPTTTIPITRNDDVITKTGITNLIGQSEGTIFWDVKDLVGSVSSGNPEFMIRNTAFTNWIGITTNTSANPFRITAKPIGVGSIIDYSANITSAKACLKYGTFGAKLFLNGNPTPVATSVVNPNFSFDNILFRGSIISFKTNRFALWTTALTDAQCISLTT